MARGFQRRGPGHRATRGPRTERSLRHATRFIETRERRGSGRKGRRMGYVFFASTFLWQNVFPVDLAGPDRTAATRPPQACREEARDGASPRPGGRGPAPGALPLVGRCGASCERSRVLRCSHAPGPVLPWTPLWPSPRPASRPLCTSPSGLHRAAAAPAAPPPCHARARDRVPSLRSSLWWQRKGGA